MMRLKNKLFSYLRLWFVYLRLSTATFLSYRTSAWSYVFSTAVWYAAMIFFIEVLYGQTDSILGWTKIHLYVLLAIFSCIETIFSIFFGGAVWKISDAIGKGSLDGSIVRPRSTLFLLLGNGVGMNQIFVFIAEVCTYIAVFSLYISVPWSLMGVLGALWGIVCGVSIMVASTVMLASLPFWFEQIEFVTEAWYSFLVVARQPLQVFSKRTLFLFYSVLPVAYFGYIPTRILMGELDPWWGILWMTLATIGALVCLWFVWKRGLERYSSASS